MELEIEYWRAKLCDAVDRYGSLQHPEVIRLSHILDDWVVKAERLQTVTL